VVQVVAYGVCVERSERELQRRSKCDQGEGVWYNWWRTEERETLSSCGGFEEKMKERGSGVEWRKEECGGQR